MPKRYKVLIIGSSGMLGTDLCQELAKDYHIIGADLVDGPRSTVRRFYNIDITDSKRISEVFDRTEPDIVVHSAAWTDVDGCELDEKRAYRVNSLGAKNVALACKRSGCLLIYISTDFVFDGRKRHAYKETDRAKPLSVYGDSKLAGEKFIKSLLKRYLILRTSWLYGRHGKNFVDTILAKGKTEKLLKVVDDQVGCPTYTGDLSRAIHVLLDRIAGSRWPIAHSAGVYHISNAGKVSWYEYAKEILRLGNSSARVVPISSEELARPARRPVMSVLDNSKFVKLTGCRLRPWKDALKEYIEKRRR